MCVRVAPFCSDEIALVVASCLAAARCSLSAEATLIRAQRRRARERERERLLRRRCGGGCGCGDAPAPRTQWAWTAAAARNGSGGGGGQKVRARLGQSIRRGAVTSPTSAMIELAPDCYGANGQCVARRKSERRRRTNERAGALMSARARLSRPARRCGRRAPAQVLFEPICMGARRRL